MIEYELDMVTALILGSGKNEDVVYIDNTDDIWVVMQCVLDEGLKCRQSISKAKWHNQILKKA